MFREDRGYSVGSLRGVGSGYNKFANESFIDEIAAALSIDPLTFRLNLLADNPRTKVVLVQAAQMADWSRKRPGRGLGIGFSDYSGTRIASIAEVSVDRATGQFACTKFGRRWTRGS